MRSLPRFRLDPGRGRFRDYIGRTVRNAISRQQARPRGAAGSLEDCVQATLDTRDEGPIEQAWEEEWSRYHMRRAMRAIRGSSKPESLAVFECLLRGESIEAVARDARMTVEAVHKVKQRVSERLRLEIERQVRDEELSG